MMKQFTRSILWSIIGILLGILPLIALAQMVIYDSDTAKNTLQESGIYKEVTPALIEANTKNADPVFRAALADPRLQELINAAIPESYVAAEAEKNIDGLYAWLQGKTNTFTPETRIDDIQKRVEEATVAYATERAAALPRCTSVAAAQASAAQPLAATCIPAGVTPAIIAEQIRSKGLAQSAELPEQNQPITSPETNTVRDTALRIINLFWVMVVATIILCAAYVALSDNHRAGIRKLGILLLITALGLAITTIVSFVIRSGVTQDMQASPFEQALLNIVREAVYSATKLFAAWAAAYGLIGLLLVLLFRKQPDKPATSATPAVAQG